MLFRLKPFEFRNSTNLTSHIHKNGIMAEAINHEGIVQLVRTPGRDPVLFNEKTTEPTLGARLVRNCLGDLNSKSIRVHSSRAAHPATHDP